MRAMTGSTVALLLLALIVGVAQGCATDRCRVQFCDDASAALTISAADTVRSAALCVNGVPLAGGASSGEAVVSRGGQFVNISQIAAPVHFSRTFFKTLTLGNGSGIAHETPQVGQSSILEGSCVVLPLVAWTVLLHDDVVHFAQADQRDCIAFAVVAPHAQTLKVSPLEVASQQLEASPMPPAETPEDVSPSVTATVLSLELPTPQLLEPTADAVLPTVTPAAVFFTETPSVDPTPEQSPFASDDMLQTSLEAPEPSFTPSPDDEFQSPEPELEDTSAEPLPMDAETPNAAFTILPSYER